MKEIGKLIIYWKFDHDLLNSFWAWKIDTSFKILQSMYGNHIFYLSSLVFES